MIRGIRFDIPNQFGSYLEKILQGYPLNSLNWFSLNSEVYIEGLEFFFEKQKLNENGIQKLSGDELQRKMQTKTHYIIFLKLYGTSKQLSQLSINNLTYAEFLESEIQLAFLVYDCVFVHVYTKSDADTQLFRQNAIRNNFENISYVTEENDILEYLDEY